MIRALLTAASVLLGMASALDPCTLGPDADAGSGSSGGGSSSGSSSGSQTVGTQCTAIVTEFCQQAVSRCGLAGFTVADCVSSDMPQCCSSGNTCDAASSQPASSVDTCKTDIDSEDCNAVTNSALPDSCQVLLHP
jgi:hypothetical protein